MTTSDALTVLGIALASVLSIGTLGAVVLQRLRRRSLRLQVVGVPVTVLLAVGVAVAVDARVMFLSSHDGAVVALGLAAAVPVAVVLAAWLGSGVSRSARRLALDAKRLGRGGTPEPSAVVSAELSSIGQELAAAGRELGAARRRAGDVERSRRELVAWVSHDLRTPLAGIRAMAEALEDGVVDDPGTYHKQLRVEADRLSGMVDTLFLLSRLHAGTMQLVREPTRVSDLVSDVLASSRPVAAARSVRLDGVADPDTVASLDTAQLSRALTNMVSNAVRHTVSEGSVTVTARRDEGAHVVFSVQDECGGIPADDVNRVFDVGWRGDDARATGPDGRGGHGLAVTRGIVEAHGGTVTVTNVDGGCRFDARLPVG